MPSLETPDVPESNTSTAVEAPPEYSGPCCPKCESPLAADQMVCRACGFYPSLGITVEIDSQWETAADPAAPPEKREALDELAASIPSWTWPLVLSNLAIVAVCVAGRFLLPAESVVREFWGVWQLVVGLALVLSMHFICFVIKASSDTDIGIVDIVVSPLKAWFKTFAELPQRLWLVTCASNGITLSLAAVLIVGGINWDRLWDWGIEGPTKSSLVDAITSAAGNGPSNDDGLEEAIQDFAGDTSMSNGKASKPKVKDTKPKPRKKTDCLIVGFQRNEREELTNVLIATELNGRLVYAGKLVPELPAEEKQEFLRQLIRSRTGAPLVKTGQVATWVQPIFPCRISYTEQAKNGHLLEMEWEELLPELKMPW